MGSPSAEYSSGVFVTSSTSGVAARNTSTTRSMMRRPPSSMSALGRPPMRVLLPPAWITPVIFIELVNLNMPVSMLTGGEGAGRGERAAPYASHRSEEHTSELQSPCNLVCRLLLEKKKKPQYNII